MVNFLLNRLYLMRKMGYNIGIIAAQPEIFDLEAERLLTVEVFQEGKAGHNLPSCYGIISVKGKVK